MEQQRQKLCSIKASTIKIQRMFRKSLLKCKVNLLQKQADHRMKKAGLCVFRGFAIIQDKRCQAQNRYPFPQCPATRGLHCYSAHGILCRLLGVGGRTVSYCGVRWRIVRGCAVACWVCGGGCVEVFEVAMKSHSSYSPNAQSIFSGLPAAPPHGRAPTKNDYWLVQAFKSES